jgi:adenylate cyclase
MFADIRGFTQFSERTEPERVVEVLNEYFTRVTDVILDHGGMIDKYIGDAVMAVFGVPISKENDAANAVRSALQIQRLVAEMNRDAAARGWPELAVGIGINTGTATAGNIGSPRRLDYTVVGDAVNIASRLMDNATGGQVLISQPTADELGPEFKLRKLRARRVRGRSEPVQVFNVEWEEELRAGQKKRRSARSAEEKS